MKLNDIPNAGKREKFISVSRTYLNVWYSLQLWHSWRCVRVNNRKCLDSSPLHIACYEHSFMYLCNVNFLWHFCINEKQLYVRGKRKINVFLKRTEFQCLCFLAKKLVGPFLIKVINCDLQMHGLVDSFLMKQPCPGVVIITQLMAPS